MKISLLFGFFTLAVFSVAEAASGPIRVLYPGKDGTPAPKHCAALMRELGRDAIWFDYTSDPGTVTREWLAKFDAVVLDAPGEEFKALARGTRDSSSPSLGRKKRVGCGGFHKVDSREAAHRGRPRPACGLGKISRAARTGKARA